MKYYTQSQLEDSRPLISAQEALTFCLDRLFEDKSHSINDLVVDGLTYEELLGCLLKAKDEIILLGVE